MMAGNDMLPDGAVDSTPVQDAVDGADVEFRALHGQRTGPCTTHMDKVEWPKTWTAVCVHT